MEAEEEADVAVIGAGLGGLTAAALLARAGLRVVVLEMDSRPGGYLAGFERRSFVFDTAIHWLNQCGPGGGVRRIFDFLDPFAPATPPLEKIRRYKSEAHDYLLTNRPEELRDRLVAEHPEQAEGIRAFFEAARTVGRSFEEMADHLRARETMGPLARAKQGLAMGRISLPFLRYLRHSTEDGFTKVFPAPALAGLFCTEERLLACLTQVGWAFSGDADVRSKFWGRSIELTPAGLLTLRFDDGEEFRWKKVVLSFMQRS